MKYTPKLILSLVLIIVFVVVCFFISIAGYTGLWLQTYKAFTQKTLVAEVTISELKKDDGQGPQGKGEYADVNVTMIQSESALAKIFGVKTSEPEKGNTKSYKLYGDVVYLGGPIVKFKDELTLINFKTIYKVAKVFSRYDLDNTKEINKSAEVLAQSSYDINGGYADWKSIHDNLTSDNLVGSLYRLVLDTTQVSEPGMFISNKSLTYNFYITNTGFLWELKN